MENVKESSACSCRRWGHWLQWNMYNSTVIASQHIYLVISLHKLLNKRVDECRQLIKIRVDHREGRVCISFDCHSQMNVIMSSKKSEKMFGPGPTGPYGCYAYGYLTTLNKLKMTSHKPHDVLNYRDATTRLSSTICSANIKENINKTPHCLLRRIRLWPLDSPHKGPAIRREFPCIIADQNSTQ